MSVKWKTKVDLIPKMENAVRQLDGKRVEAGVFGEQAWLVGIHEYGCKIPVTAKMRAYLHSQGLHLKASTKFITIPERAFLRNGFDQSKDEIVSDAESVLGDVLSGHMSVDLFLNDVIGLPMESAIKDYAIELDSPPNHPFTIARKKSSNPLVDSGDMIGAISHRVEG